MTNAIDFLVCPFCRRDVEGPKEIMSRFGNVFNGGRCGCGAVYVYDRTGHNLGSAYVDLLAYACDDDLEKAWGLNPDEDYEVIELSYDSRRRKFTGKVAGISRSPVFLFLRLKKLSAQAQAGTDTPL